jgi:hypothetical protein
VLGAFPTADDIMFPFDAHGERDLLCKHMLLARLDVERQEKLFPQSVSATPGPSEIDPRQHSGRITHVIREMLATYLFSIAACNLVLLQLLLGQQMLATYLFSIAVGNLVLRGYKSLALNLLAPTYAHALPPFQECAIVLLVFKPGQCIIKPETWFLGEPQ